MIKIKTELGIANIVQAIDELPNIPIGSKIYCDAETTSGDDKLEGFDPFIESIKAGGWAITWDRHPEAYYIPIRHHGVNKQSQNLPVEAVTEWLNNVMANASCWINHNVKFDMQFLKKDGAVLTVPVKCTEVMSRLIDSDRINHKLKDLCRKWCGLNMSDEYRVDAYLKTIKSKDYGRVPIDILGEYAAMDVFGNRVLYHECLSRLPECMNELWETEQKFTYILFDMENEGLKINVRATKIEKAKHLRRQIDLEDIIKDLTGVDFTDSPQCIYEILCVQLGLPVLEYQWSMVNNKFVRGGPKFDAEALELYEGRPEVINDEHSLEVVKALRELRHVTQNISLFLSPFLELHDANDFVHPKFRQNMRTGRLSAAGPNCQQFNPLASSLCEPPPGYKLLCADGKQMEFRFIVHYTKIQRAIEAFHAGDIDYHQFVADICEIIRKAGKTLNFTMAFGGGKKKVKQQLISKGGIISTKPPEMSMLDFMKEADRTAENVFNRYHHEFPEIGRASEAAANTALVLGYVQNFYGRRRQLDSNFSYRGFNAVVQSTSSDFIKRKMIETSPRYNAWYRERDVRIVSNKHDEILWIAPINFNEGDKIIADLTDRETFRVPIEWDYKESSTNWKLAKP